MTNNAVCNLVAGIGGAVTFISAVAIFFGASCWFGAIAGIIACAVALFNYED